MNSTIKGFIVGALALAGAMIATTDVQAMPIQPLSPAVADVQASGGQVEQVYFYGYRRPFLRYGYGYRRPFFRRYYRPFLFRRPFYGYRRPFYGYRRF